MNRLVMLAAAAVVLEAAACQVSSREVPPPQLASVQYELKGAYASVHAFTMADGTRCVLAEHSGGTALSCDWSKQ